MLVACRQLIAQFFFFDFLFFENLIAIFISVVHRKAKVPEVLLATIEIPENLQIVGRGCLVHAQACRYKKDLKSESNAKEISDALPFLEYDLQRLLVNKLKAKGMNAIFGLKISISIGEKMMALIGTGTGVYLPALPSPNIPKIVQGNSWTNVEKINELNRSLEEAVNRNREIYQLKVYSVIIDICHVFHVKRIKDNFHLLRMWTALAIQ